MSDSRTKRQQLIGALVIGVLIVAALVWINRSDDQPTETDGGRSVTVSMNATADSAPLPSGLAQGLGKVADAGGFGGF